MDRLQELKNARNALFYQMFAHCILKLKRRKEPSEPQSPWDDYFGDIEYLFSDFPKNDRIKSDMKHLDLYAKEIDSLEKDIEIDFPAPDTKFFTDMTEYKGGPND